jgi:flagellar biosynthesis protein FlhF
MKVKRYRAATMREALEKVKHDIGEEALVLETKKVRAGGFFGFGATEQVEVRVALDSVALGRVDKTKNAARPQSMLDLRDDAPAKPAHERESVKRNAGPGLAALAARAYSRETVLPQDESARKTMVQRAPQTVELSEEMPEFNPPAVRNNSRIAVERAPVNNTEPAQPTSLNGEIEGLRAELREVKFTLGALSSRHKWSMGETGGTASIFEQDPEIFDSPYYEPFVDLTSSGLSPELARRAVRAGFAGKPAISYGPAASRMIAREGLVQVLSSEVAFAPDPLLNTEGSASAPSVLAFIGPTGVGKTTTIAKLAARIAVRERRRVELITLDTYRIAAVEQLKTYADIIGTGCHVARSVLELDATRRRLQQDAIVLIDTIGKSPHDLADQMELADYLRTSEDIVKALVFQASIHPDDSLISASKFGLYGASCLVITKLDETSRPGALANIVAGSGLPIVYLGTGQRVPEDIEPATPETFAAHILRAQSMAAAA